MNRTMNEFQEILENGISRINDLHRIAAVEWWDGLDYAGDKVQGVMFTDEDEIVHIVSFHNPAASDYERKLYELDCILINIVLQRIFKENGIACPYCYPITLNHVSGLVNDARKLFRMKQQGNMKDFAFEYCLMDVRKEPWKGIAHYVWVDLDGLGSNELMWDEMLEWLARDSC